MLKNYLTYTSILWLLSQLLVGINCMTVNETWVHTATFIDNKLYILNGREVLSMNPMKEFIYLDFSAPFNTQQLYWQDLSSVNTIPTHYGATSVKGGVNNNTLFLYGGMLYGTTSTKLVYTFDPQSETWSSPEITGGNNIRKQSLTGIVDYRGNMYLWGGESIINGYSGQVSNDMLILDTVNLNWRVGSSVGAPTQRRFYGATLLPNQNIIYIGGRQNSALQLLSLNEVYLYDTINDKWSTKTTSGTIPSNRDGFSVVLGLDGQRIIIFGGSNSTNADALYALTLNDFTWYVPNVSGQIPNSRSDHKANVIGNYMVVSFGNGYHKNRSNESDIILLDISNNDEYVWTNEFIPQTTHSRIEKTKSQPIVPAIIGAIVGSVVLLGVGIFLWNRNKRNQKKVNPVRESEEGNDYKHDNSVTPTEKDANDEKQEVPPNNITSA